MNNPAPYTGPFPRKRHSHRCTGCGGNAVACYRAQCTRAQRVNTCAWCAREALPTLGAAVAEQANAAAQHRGDALTGELRKPLADVSRIAGAMESHTPLFRGSDADPQRSLF